MPTTSPTPYPCEHWHNAGGIPHYYTEEEVQEVEERYKPREAEIVVLPKPKKGKPRFSLVRDT